jgi:diacylglycerol kinase (ATP)
VKPGKTGFARIVDATHYSFRGLRACWRHEAAFRQEVALCMVLTPAAFWLAGSAAEWLHLVTPLFVLLVVELLNSAVESTVDRIGGERHELSGRAKDMGSAAVMIVLVWTACAWGALIWERFA